MRRLLLPSLALVAALGADLWLGVELPEAPGGLRWIAIQRSLAIAVFLLAWRLRRGRIAWIMLAFVAVAEWTRLDWPQVTSGAEGGEGIAPSLAPAIAAGLWLFFDVAAAAWLREWWLWSRTGVQRLAILAAQAMTVIVLTEEAARPAAETLVGFAPSFLPALSIPTVLALGWALSCVLTAAAFWRRKSPLEAGLLCALGAAGCAFALPASWHLYFATASACLLIALVENAFTLAFQDGLTGLPARRALEERLPQLGRSYALAMLDLDHFKKLNDRHGHEVGDQVLRLVAARLRRLPGGGEAFRYGGEEFTVVFPGKDAQEAAVYLDAVRQRIASRPFTVRSPGRPAKKPKAGTQASARGGAVQKSLKVTVSIGVADRGGQTQTPEQVMKAADRALYRAKKAGRNRVQTA